MERGVHHAIIRHACRKKQDILTNYLTISMFGFGPSNTDTQYINSSGSALDILEKPYALNQIDMEEYEERKGTLTDTNNQ